jgi:hypothetical protein
MQKAVFIFLLATAAAVCHAQITPPTIKGHTLGESLQEFIEHSNTDTKAQISQCSTRPAYLSCDRDYPSVVKTGSGSLRCYPFLDRADTNVCHDFIGTATFDGGKLVAIELIIAEWADALTDISAKFGNPTETGTASMQNQFGAKFDVQTATWVTSGVLAYATEEVNPNYSHPRYVRATFTDRKYFEAQQAKKHQSNALD